ncbi:MAG: YCF48-related protein [Patescibacteria group bacterium]|jgi:photosystem II stability/assembly factor-like uncharacterized protein
MKKIYFVFFLLAGLVLTGAGCISFSGGGTSGTDGGIFKSADKAENWGQKVAVAAVQPGSLANVNVVSLVFDPADSKTMYLATAENGLFYTTDGAESWFTAGSLAGGRINAVAPDAKDKCNVYAAAGNKIFKTSDCTRSWQNIYVDTRADQAVTALAADSYTPSIIYAGLSGGDFLKSTDSGASWTVTKRFENQVMKILVNFYDTRIIYVGTQGRGVWKTTDGGANWTDLSEKLNQFDGARDYKNLILDFSKRDSLILASRYGLLRSSDGGSSWQAINLLTPPGSVDIYSLAANPQNGNEIYYGTTSTLYKTSDGGSKWVTKKLPTTRAATYLLVDPGNGSIVYLGTTRFQK